MIRHSRRLRLHALASGIPLAICAAPAWATTGPPVPQLAMWFVLGLAVSVAAALLLGWSVLRERMAPPSAWLPYVLACLLGLAIALGLGGRWPLLGLGVAAALVAWGIGLVHRLLSRMQRLLEERDHARAEAQRAQRDSERDALTGVLNRGAWRARLEQIVNDCQEAQPPRPVSVLFFDIDLFKLINDSLGHGVGDDCLKAVANVVAAELRGGDVLGRMGGEEFAVALPGAKRVHSIAVAERIRMAVQNHCRVVGEEVVELTVSIGASEYLGPHELLDALVDRADRAMYTAKDSGRNMVVADAATPGPG